MVRRDLDDRLGNDGGEDEAEEDCVEGGHSRKTEKVLFGRAEN